MRKINVEQGTVEWFELRFGCVTGTRIHSAAGAKWDARAKKWKLGDKKIQDTLMNEILSERMSQNQIEEVSSKAMERGNELEPFAVAAASEKRGFDFLTCGMLQGEVENFRFSPDAIYELDGKIVGGLECKCPSGKKHMEYIIGDTIPREYFWQVMGAMILDDEVQWWDFCSYDDRNYEKPLFLIRANREDYQDLILEAREHVIDFLNRVEQKHMELTF